MVGSAIINTIEASASADALTRQTKLESFCSIMTQASPSSAIEAQQQTSWPVVTPLWSVAEQEDRWWGGGGGLTIRCLNIRLVSSPTEFEFKPPISQKPS